MVGLIEVNTLDLRELSVKLAEVEPRLRVLLRHELADAGQGAKEAIAGEAGWSSRIPGSLKVKVSFAARGTAVSVVADRKVAPEARVLEHGGKDGTFNHPVYPTGPRETWHWLAKDKKQPARPFFEKGAEKYELGAFQAKVEAIGEEFALALGFR